MNDWVVETPSFEEDLMNNRVVMLNQVGVNRVVEIIKEKDKEIERLNRKIKSIVYQCYGSDMSYGEFKQIWINAMGKTYEPSQIDELEKELGVIKNE